MKTTAATFSMLLVVFAATSWAAEAGAPSTGPAGSAPARASQGYAGPLLPTPDLPADHDRDRDHDHDHASMVPGMVPGMAPAPAVATGQPAQESEQPPESAALRFRRVYVPEGAANWPKGDAKYLPLDAAEFERLLSAIQRTTPGLPAQSAAGFEKAHYECRLKGRSLLQGSAELDVSSAIAGSTLLRLGRCNLAIDRPRWTTSEGLPAAMGMTNDGRLQVVSERAGQMEFEWSLAGQTDAVGGTSFVIRLPPCPDSQLQIELPAELTPSTDHGVMSDEGVAEKEFRRWNLDLGGWSTFNLRIAGKGEADTRRPVILAEQTTSCRLTLRGVDMSVELNVAAHRDPLRSIALDLEPSLDLVEVAANDRPLSWSLTKQPRGKRQQAVVEIPPPLQEGVVKLLVRAIAPLTTDGTWKIPRITAAGAACRTSTLRLAVESPLRVAAVTPHGCRQTGVASQRFPAGEEFDFVLLDPEGGVDILLAGRSADVEAMSAATTVIGQGKISSRVAADFRTGEGPVFVLNAAVGPFWAIDSVASQPEDAVDDWTVLGRESARKLSVRLARPLTSARPLRLIVSARRLYAGSDRGGGVHLDLDDVVPLRFSAPIECRRLVDLRTGSATELRVAESPRARHVDVKELTAAELDLFADPPGDVLLRDNGGAPGPLLTVAARRPAYTGDIRLDAVVAGGMLEENYTILCTPTKNAPVDRLVVHFSGHRDTPLTWSVAGVDESGFSAHRWTAAQESLAGLTGDEEAWDVALVSQRSSPLELRARRKSRIGGPLPLCLASLPDAAAQQGRVVVRNLGPQAVQFDTQRVTSLRVEAAPPGQIQTVRAAYRYDPREETTPQPTPAVIVRCAVNELPPAWAWECSVRSQFAADGAGSHHVAYRLENAGDRRVALKLPAPLKRSDAHEISINGRLATVSSADAGNDVLLIDIPADAKNVELSLRIATHGQPLATLHRLQPPLPEIDLPVFARHWTVELPPGFAALYGNEEAEAGPADSYALRRRLLGCLGRGEQQKIFNPLSAGDWRGLIPNFQLGSLRESRGPIASDAAVPPGWSLYRVDLADGDANVTIVYRPMIEAAGWLLFLAIVALGTWRRTGRPITLIALTVVCGSCALLLPASLAAIFSCGLLGLAFCFLLALVRKRSETAAPRADASPDVPSTLTSVVPFAAPAFLAMLLCSPSAVGAAEPSKAPPVYSIYIPVNGKQEPTGGKYLVPEAFYSELYRRAGQQAEKPQGWMIASAVYRAALAENAVQREVAIERLTAEYGIHVFAAAARIRIPLRRDEVSLVPDQASLEDRPVQPEWDADGSALLLDIAEPGKYRLSLSLRPSAPRDDRAGGFDLAIPRVPSARLEVTVPAGGPPITAPSALGAVHWEEIPSRWNIELGPAERLAVRWPDASAPAEETVNAELLQWLKVEPGCVLMDVRIKAKAAAGLRRLQLKAGPALKLLASPEGAPATAFPPTVAWAGDGSQTIEFRFPAGGKGDSPVLATPPLASRPGEPAARPAAQAKIGTVPAHLSAADDVVLDLHFLCTDMSSIGTLHAPPIEVLGSHLTHRWLAVSIDHLLECQLSTTGNPRAGGPDAAVSEFLGNWGVAEAPPDFAFRLSGNAAEWSMTTRAGKPETSGEAETRWTFDDGPSQVQFEARLTTTGGNTFQHRFALPPELRVDSLVVNSQGSVVPTRWIRDPDGRLTLFLQSATTGRHQLQLRGRLTLPMNHRLQLPQLRMEDVHLQSSVVRLYQREAVVAEVVAPAGLTEVKPGAESLGDAAKFLRSFYVDPAGAGAISVTLHPAALQQVRPGAVAAPPREPPLQTPGAARIAAADVRYVWGAPDSGSAKRSVGAAVFDLASPRAGDYPLELPPGFQLLHVTVDGVPIDAVRAASETWTIPLSPHGPKSRIEILFAAGPGSGAATAAASGHITFRSPRLGALPVERARWAISLPRGLQAVSADSSGASVAAAGTAGSLPGELDSRWQEFAGRGGNIVRYDVVGPSDSITLNYRAGAAASWLPPLLSTMGFLAAIVLVAWSVRGKAAPIWLVRSPSLVGIVLGLAWWLWAWPSVLGMAIVAAIVARKLLKAQLVRQVAS